MSEDLKKEDEYKFQEETQESDEYEFQKDMQSPNEGAILEETSPMDKDDQMESIKKKVFIGAGALIVVIVMYNIFSGVFTSHSNIKDTKEVIVNSEIQEIGEAVDNNIKDFPPISTNENIANSSNPIVTRDDSLLLKTQDDLSRVMRSLNNLQKTLEKIDTKLIELQDNQEEMQQQIEQVNEPVMVVEEKKAEAKAIVKEKMHAIGIIYGRAWLQKENGSTITVKIGDILPGYGSIKYIEPEQGVVITESGDAIVFHDSEI